MTLLLSPVHSAPAQAQAPAEAEATDNTEAPTASPAKETAKKKGPKGYIPTDQSIDVRAYLPPPPGASSALQDMDNAWHKRMLNLRGTERWDVAEEDSHLAFPKAADIFSCALGIPVTQEDTPALYALLERTKTDIKGTADAAKNLHHRKRPFLTDDTPVCTPGQMAHLRTSSSYPSGHAATGWGWALILSQLAPEHAGKILERGFTFGESRTVCNVHWYSDTVAARMVAAGTVAVLNANAEFRDAMNKAEAEIAEMRTADAKPIGDCSVQIKELTDVPAQ